MRTLKNTETLPTPRIRARFGTLLNFDHRHFQSGQNIKLKKGSVAQVKNSLSNCDGYLVGIFQNIST